MRSQVVLKGLLAVAVLLLASAVHDPTESRSTRLFGFKIRLQRSPQSAGSFTLHQGTVLQPIGRGGQLYQSVVLCKDTVFHFDLHGLSDLVAIEGFCVSAHMEVPPKDVQWSLTGKTMPSIREKCDLAAQGEAREPKNPPACQPLDTCRDKSRDECIDQFNQYLRTKDKYGHKSFDDLHPSRCNARRTIHNGVKQYELVCDC